MSQKALHFVQRGRILLRCGSALALSLPSLGVSSLDLGRLFTQAALFSCAMILRCAFFLRHDSCMRFFLAPSFRDGPNGSALAPAYDGLRTRPQMCNCTSGNLVIPGSLVSLAPSDAQLRVGE